LKLTNTYYLNIPGERGRRRFESLKWHVKPSENSFEKAFRDENNVDWSRQSTIFFHRVMIIWTLLFKRKSYISYVYARAYAHFDSVHLNNVQMIIILRKKIVEILSVRVVLISKSPFKRAFTWLYMLFKIISHSSPSSPPEC